MEQQKLLKDLAGNLAFFQARFVKAMDLILRRVELGGRPAALLAVDGLVNKEVITLSVLEPLLRERAYPSEPEKQLAFIERRVLSAADLKHEAGMDALLQLLMSGFAVLLLDGVDDALAAAAVTIWRRLFTRISPAANTPGISVCIFSSVLI